MISTVHENIIRNKIKEFYHKSNHVDRCKGKWIFDETITIGDQKASIFETDRINLLLFMNGAERDLDLRSFFLNPNRRNVSTIRFSFARLMSEEYFHDKIVCSADFLLKPDEVKDHILFTVCNDSLYIDDRLLPELFRAEIRRHSFISFIIKLRLRLLESLSSIAFLKLLDSLRTSRGLPVSLQSIYTSSAIQETEYYKMNEDWLPDFLTQYNYRIGLCRLAQIQGNGSFFAARVEKQQFADLIEASRKLVDNLRVTLAYGRRDESVNVDGYFTALLKDCCVELNQEYPMQKGFASQDFAKKIIGQNGNILKQLEAVIEKWYKSVSC